VLHARLDAAYQRLDLSTAQAIIDVNPGGNRLSWAPIPSRSGGSMKASIIGR